MGLEGIQVQNIYKLSVLSSIVFLVV